MELYDFNNDAYNEIVKKFNFRFLKQIKNTGIVFNEILFANNLVTDAKFYILVCNDQEKTYYIRFKDLKVLLIRLTQIATNRLEKLKLFEKELMAINDTECYGESQYFNDTEITAIGISSINELLIHFIEKIQKLNIGENVC